MKRGGRALKLYEYSLASALLALFLASFVLHGLSGLRRINAENVLHGEAPMSFGRYVGSAQF